MDVVTLALAKKYSDGKFGSSNIWDGIEEPGTINTSTGEEEESTNGRRMPHDKGIAVDPSTTYYIKKNTSAKIRYTFYGANGEYIGNTDALGHSLVDSDVMSQKMVPPVGATLFRAFSPDSLVNAGLTVAVGIGADLADVNESISQINRDLTNIEIIELELDGTKVTSGFMYIIKRLGHCTVVGNNLKFNSSLSGQVDVLPVGALPKAAISRWFMTPLIGFPLSGNVTVASKAEFCGTYGGEGKLTMWIDNATSEIGHFFTLTYPCEVN